MDKLQHWSRTKHAFERDFDVLDSKMIDDQNITFWLEKQNYRDNKLLIATGPSFKHDDSIRLAELLMATFQVNPQSEWETELVELNPDANILFLVSIGNRNTHLKSPVSIGVEAIELLEDQGYTIVIDPDSVEGTKHSSIKSAVMSKIKKSLNDLSLPEKHKEESEKDENDIDYDDRVDDELEKIKSLSGLKK
jgi:hypothetical protein